jgi:hypothetical protein
VQGQEVKRPAQEGVSVLTAITVGADVFRVVWASIGSHVASDRRLVAKGPDGLFYTFWLQPTGEWRWTYAYKSQAEAIADVAARVFKAGP